MQMMYNCSRKLVIILDTVCKDLKILASREKVESEEVGTSASSTVLTLHKKKPKGTVRVSVRYLR